MKVTKLKLFFLALIFQIIGIIIFKVIFVTEIQIFDPRFEQLAYNLTVKGTMKINWGISEKPDTIMQSPYNIQKGVYYNWFPPGYSIFLIPFILTGKFYLLTRTVVQLFLFSFIPIVLTMLIRLVYKSINDKEIILINLFYIINPYYLVSSLWGTDTWFVILINILSFYFFLRIILNLNEHVIDYKASFLLGILLSLMFFIRPIVILPYIIILLISIFKIKFRFSGIKIILIPLLFVSIVISVWTLKNYYYNKVLMFTYSNIGYNLWLGNNKFTNDFLKNHLGDGATIEDKIIPLFDQQWVFLENFDEYSKDKFFFNEALNFIINNKNETLSNIFWKFIGFFSPFRVRGNHWSNSFAKNIFTIIYNLPIILLFFFTFFRNIKGVLRLEFDKPINLIIIFIFIFLFPHLMLFSTARFRAHIDFLIFIVCLDSIFFIRNYLRARLKYFKANKT